MSIYIQVYMYMYVYMHMYIPSHTNHGVTLMSRSHTDARHDARRVDTSSSAASFLIYVSLFSIFARLF